MSSPYSNLNKSRKTHLPAYGLSSHRPVPFRQTMDIMDLVRSPRSSVGDDIDEERLLGEVTATVAEAKMKQRDPFGGGFPKLSDSKPGSRGIGAMNTSVLGPNDMELMSSMMSRISQLELRAQFQAKELADKDRKVNILEDKLKILNKSRAEGDQVKIVELQKQNHRLQNQIHDMEVFLADYGMIWVGEESSSDTDSEDLESEPRQEPRRTWSQAASISAGEFKVDYDLIIDNIKELNILAGDGVGRVQQTSDGARLRMPDPVNFTLYANGILLFNGPFRPFSDPETQHCLRDIMDGYFPSELQSRYPDGVPFLVTDKRKVNFKDKRSDIFKGAAQTLGGDTKPSRLVPSNLEPSPKPAVVTSDAVEETSGLPGPKLTVDQFLRKIPASVVKQGKVIDIRASLSQTLKGNINQRNNTVMLLETEAVKDMKSRLEEDESSRPPSSRNVATLRIKGEDQTYILKMRFQETVGDIRRYLDKKRKSGAPSYELVSSFPKKVFDDNHMTLEEAELIPNATLHLKPKK